MSALSPSSLRHEDVSQRAYTIWERNGRPEGNEQEHWYLAERELMQTGVPSIAAELAEDKGSEPALRSKSKPSKR